ncbi:MAG TPA: L-histidine N(alpha)-methyltransferase [Candidatus Saccharimonadales bacterium]|nr:L-histidine N(alpha)-methyltransferase [Candidatus Saccharimonadales bacterium]
MKYFKNAELVRLYSVSDKSVRNWIQAAESGKVDLELYVDGDKTYIADTVRNETLLEEFTSRAKKYRNSQSHRKLTALPGFYQIFTDKQIIDIVTSLDVQREIPPQYPYHGPGAVSWSSYLHKLYNARAKNILTNTIDLVNLATPYIHDVMGDHKKLNVVDLGAGNGLAAKDLISNLLTSGKLHTYFAVDNSPGLLGITGHNMQTWFKGQVTAQTLIKDLTYERVIEASYGTKDGETGNIFLFLGGLINNFREPLQILHTIHDSMTSDDILLTSLKLDTKTSRRFFDVSIDSTDKTKLPDHDRIVLDLLGIEPDIYEIEQFFDRNEMKRQVRVKLKVAVTLYIKNNLIDKVLRFEKGESILLWRSWHYTAESLIDQFKQAGFVTMQASKSKDEEAVLLISKVQAVDRPKLQ